MKSSFLDVCEDAEYSCDTKFYKAIFFTSEIYSLSVECPVLEEFKRELYSSYNSNIGWL